MNIALMILRLSLLIVGLFGFTVSTNADVLWLKGKDQPLVGALIGTDTAGTVEFGVAGEDSISTFPAEVVDVAIKTFDTKRLSSLSPERISEYRDHAEELAAQKIDPEARELAIRLLLIAAYLGDKQDEIAIVDSALASLIPLARSPDESSKLMTLQTLYSKNSIHIDRNADLDATSSELKTTVAAKKLLECVRHARREQFEAARSVLQSAEVMRELKNWSKLVSMAEMDNVLNSDRLTTQQLKKLLTLESALLDPDDSIADQTHGWYEQSRERTDAWTSIPTFGNVTEFDPSLSVYRDGQWQHP